ncbi:hypothetical protein ENBRE01_0557 [Enteropsectra breve]|nr:hypothetical protein ENBRE01_0557 [Enteropsectra breve]
MVYISGSSIIIFMLKIVPILTAGPLRDWDESFSLPRTPHESYEHAMIPRVFVLKDQCHTPNIAKKHIIVTNDLFSLCKIQLENYAIRLKNYDFQTVIPLGKNGLDEGTKIIFHTIGSILDVHCNVKRTNGRLYLEWEDHKPTTIIGNLEELQREGFEEVRINGMSRHGTFLLTGSSPFAMHIPQA